jgi:hypothetical protein
MEYIDGVKVNNVQRLREIGVDPKWVGRILQEIFSEMYVSIYSVCGILLSMLIVSNSSP